MMTDAGLGATANLSLRSVTLFTYFRSRLCFAKFPPELSIVDTVLVAG